MGRCIRFEKLFDNENHNRIYVELRNPISATGIAEKRRLLHRWNLQRRGHGDFCFLKKSVFYRTNPSYDLGT